jgi:glycosyltransferase involved in cell wall biosynthesis
MNKARPFLFSIITPCLNRADYIASAIESVQNQPISNVEHIVVDGGSRDGTLEILHQYSHVRVFSEKDTGMYAALNKGISYARGNIIGFLNSDDLYAENAFVGVEQKFSNDDIQAVVGRAEVFTDIPGKESIVVDTFSPENSELLKLATIGSPFMNAWFFRSSVFQKIGGFNANYRIVADREFMLRLAISGLKYSTIAGLVYRYRRHAGAMTFDINDQKLERIVLEHHTMTESFFSLPNLPRRARQFIQQAHTQDTITMAARCFRKRDFRRGMFFSRMGFQKDLTWGIRLGLRIGQNLLRRIPLPCKAN